MSDTRTLEVKQANQINELKTRLASLDKALEGERHSLESAWKSQVKIVSKGFEFGHGKLGVDLTKFDEEAIFRLIEEPNYAKEFYMLNLYDKIGNWEAYRDKFDEIENKIYGDVVLTHKKTPFRCSPAVEKIAEELKTSVGAAFLQTYGTYYRACVLKENLEIALKAQLDEREEKLEALQQKRG